MSGIPFWRGNSKYQMIIILVADGVFVIRYFEFSRSFTSNYILKAVIGRTETQDSTCNLLALLLAQSSTFSMPCMCPADIGLEIGLHCEEPHWLFFRNHFSFPISLLYSTSHSLRHLKVKLSIFFSACLNSVIRLSTSESHPKL